MNDASTSTARRSRTSSPHARSWVTDSRASRLKPPSNTESRASSSWSGSDSRLNDHAIRARSDRWRSSCQRGAVSDSSSWRRRSTSVAGGTARTRAAASSTASGSSSTRRQMVATVSGSSGPRYPPARARRSNSSTAHGASRGSSGCSCSPGMPSDWMLVASTRLSPASAIATASSPASAIRCSQLSSTTVLGCSVRKRAMDAGVSGTPGVSGAPTDRATTVAIWPDRTAASSTSTGGGPESPHRSMRARATVVLPTPARPTTVTSECSAASRSMVSRSSSRPITSRRRMVGTSDPTWAVDPAEPTPSDWRARCSAASSPGPGEVPSSSMSVWRARAAVRTAPAWSASARCASISAIQRVSRVGVSDTSRSSSTRACRAPPSRTRRWARCSSACRLISSARSRWGRKASTSIRSSEGRATALGEGRVDLGGAGRRVRCDHGLEPAEVG